MLRLVIEVREANPELELAEEDLIMISFSSQIPLLLRSFPLRHPRFLYAFGN